MVKTSFRKTFSTAQPVPFMCLFLLQTFQVPGIQAVPVSDYYQQGLDLFNDTGASVSNDSPLFRYNSTKDTHAYPTLVELSEDQELEKMTAAIHGFRVEEVDKGVSYEDKNKGISSILAESTAYVRLYGERFTRNTVIRFVTEKQARGSDCDDISSTKQFSLLRLDLTYHSALTKIQLPPLLGDEEVFYICAREKNNEKMPWVHQGSESWIQIKTYERMLPMWAQCVIIVILLALSGLFSGLNLGLMSLDRTEMKIIAATGTDKERRYAKSIQPLRDNGNYLLCTLLLGNVLVNSTLTILLDDLSSGLVAVIASTISIVLLGEIVPQAICSRHGLAVGARTVWLTKLFMALTFPLSYPISVILDKILGEEIGNVYNRERLKELIRVTGDYNDLEKDEVNIIAGALELKQKVVADVMTKLEDIFMLPSDAVLDFDTVSEIMSQGYSRVPIYEGSKKNLISLLYTKDLAFVDTDDKMPLRTICEFYSNPIMYVFETTTLDVVFREFKTGNKGHMAFAQRVNDGEKGSDPYYEITGLVTMEDVIEALIKAEINDETDVYDSIRRRRSKVQLALAQPLASGLRWGCANVHVSPQLVLAAFQYLSTSVDEFSSSRISKPILQRLLSQNLFFQIKVKSRDYVQHGDKAAIYERGKPADYFVLILEGRVQVEMGKENLLFESGPFSYFGVHLLNLAQGAVIGENPGTPEMRKGGANSNSVESLLHSSLIPDYTVRPLVDTTFLKISRSMYLTAKQATVFEKTLAHTEFSSDKDIGDHFQSQIDQMLFCEGENASNRNFLRRKSSVAKAPNWMTNTSGLSKLASSRDPDLLVSNQNTFPQATERNVRRHSELLSELLLTPRHLLDSYDRPSKGKQPNKTIDANVGVGDRNVTFHEDKIQNDKVIKEPETNVEPDATNAQNEPSYDSKL